jgi:hypothetical protein
MHIRKPENKNCLIRPEDIYNIKGATEWVDSATSALIMEKRQWGKPGESRLSFAKQREASSQPLQDLELKFNYETCSFEYREVEVSEEGDYHVIRVPK